jgi:hypothetical protein
MGSAIDHNDALEVDCLEANLLHFSLKVVLIDLPGKVRNIDASITFSSNVKIIGHEFRELGKPVFQSD